LCNQQKDADFHLDLSCLSKTCPPPPSTPQHSRETFSQMLFPSPPFPYFPLEHHDPSSWVLGRLPPFPLISAPPASSLPPPRNKGPWEMINIPVCTCIETPPPPPTNNGRCRFPSSFPHFSFFFFLVLAPFLFSTPDAKRRGVAFHLSPPAFGPVLPALFFPSPS